MKNKMDLLKAAVLTSAIFASSGVAMPNAYAAALTGGMDAGVIKSGLDQEREWRPHDDAPEVEVNLGEAKGEVSAVKIGVKGFNVTADDKKLDIDAMKAELNSHVTAEMTLTDLQNACAKLTDKLHADGYMTALAYLPPQEIVGGIVRVEVMAGHYDTPKVWDNTSELTTSRADGLTWSSNHDRLIEKRRLDKQLYILNDIPGVRAHAVLYPGSDEGHAAVKYILTTTETDGGYIYLDNYGSRFTGKWRFGGSYHYNNVSHVGDQISVAYLQSCGANLRNYSASYSLPVGNYGTFAGIEYSKTDYHLGDVYYPLDARGTSTNWRLFTRSSMKRTLNNNSFFLFEVDYAKLSDCINAYDTDSEKHDIVFRFGYDGDYRDRRSASTYKLMHNIGHLTMETQNARESDDYKTAGTWQKTTFDGYNIYYPGKRLELHSNLRVQYAWDNLDSSEKFYISGYNGVRAFSQGESGGDSGVLFSTELRYQLDKERHYQLAAFYDLGYSRYIHRYPNGVASADKNGSLQGVGLGLIYRSRGGTYARLDYAVPLGKSYSVSEGKDVNGRFWLRVIQAF